jgi:ABC-type antimicrobial peptide transport system permease subunit
MYGVMSYSVAQRRREIGIRVAIGAARSQVLALVMRQGLRMVAIGTVIGLAGAILGARLVQGLLYGATGFDAATMVGVPLVLVVVAAVAIWIPARRAATIDPMIALREE